MENWTLMHSIGAIIYSTVFVDDLEFTAEQSNEMNQLLLAYQVPPSEIPDLHISVLNRETGLSSGSRQDCAEVFMKHFQLLKGLELPHAVYEDIITCLVQISMQDVERISDARRLYFTQQASGMMGVNKYNEIFSQILEG